uniref:Carbonic anhydrase n=1 Tax=Hippocampus comes TaxID=109280 RepID=A0A3Q2XSH4_HIPCM
QPTEIVVRKIKMGCVCVCAGGWCYENQASCDAAGWSSAFPRCGGLRQSPINIVSGKVHVNTNKGHSGKDVFEPHLLARTQIANNFFLCSAHFHLPQSVRLTGGALPGHYRAAQFHFHWGASGRPGSEHTVDGERFPMELHVVHIKEPYGSLSEAEHDMAGIALLAFLFEVARASAATSRRARWLRHNGRDPRSTALMSDFKLSDIVPPSGELRGYYRYVGSMTTPGCEQAVAWTVFLKTLPVSGRQQCRFWTGQPMTDIFRPTQPLDGRVVYRSNSAGAVAPARSAAFWLGLAALIR